MKTAFVYLTRHVDSKIFKVKFVLSVKHDIVIGDVLFADVVHLINGVNTLFQNVLLDLFDALVLITLSYSRQLLEEISRKLIKRNGAVNLYDVRRLRPIQ